MASWADYGLLTEQMPKNRFEMMDRTSGAIGNIADVAGKAYGAWRGSKAREIKETGLKHWDTDLSQVPTDPIAREQYLAENPQVAEAFAFFGPDVKDDAGKYRMTASRLEPYDTEGASEMLKYAEDRDQMEKQLEIAKAAKERSYQNQDLDNAQQAYNSIENKIRNLTEEASKVKGTDAERWGRLMQDRDALEANRVSAWDTLRQLAPGLYKELPVINVKDSPEVLSIEGAKPEMSSTDKQNELFSSDIYDANGVLDQKKFVAKARDLGMSGEIGMTQSDVGRAWANAQEAARIKQEQVSTRKAEADRQRGIVKEYREQANGMVQPFKERFAPWSTMADDAQIAQSKVESIKSLVKDNPAAAFSAIRAVNQSFEKGVTRNEEFIAMGGGPLVGKFRELQSLLETQNPNSYTAARAVELLDALSKGTLELTNMAAQRFSDEANKQLGSSKIDPRNPKSGSFSQYKTVTPRDFYTAVDLKPKPAERKPMKKVVFR